MTTTLVSPHAALWRKYTECRSPRLRGKLFTKNLGIAEAAAARLCDALPDLRIDRNDVVIAARLLLIDAIERFTISPQRAEFQIFATAYITRRLIDALTSGQHPIDAIIASHHDVIRDDEDPELSAKQLAYWTQHASTVGGLTQLEFSILGLHVIEVWSCQELASRFRLNERTIRRTVGDAIMKMTRTIQTQGAAHA